MMTHFFTSSRGRYFEEMLQIHGESKNWFQFKGCSLCKAASYRKRPLRDRVTDTLRPLSYESPTFIGRGAREGVGGRSLSSTIQGYQPCNSKTPKTTLKRKVFFV